MQPSTYLHLRIQELFVREDFMMNLDDRTLNPQTSETLELSTPSRSKRIFQLLGWSVFTLFALTVFTLLKLPDDRIRATIENSLSTILANRGITLQSEESQLSLIFGPEYQMKKVTLTSSLPPQTMKIDEVRLSPSLLPLLIGKWGGTTHLTQGTGKLKLSGSVRNTQTFFQIDGEKFDLGATGILSIALGVQANAIFDGQGIADVDTNDLSTLEANLHGQLSQLVIDPQIIAGFRIPKLTISEAVFDLKTEKGKLILSSVKLGKTGQLQDDIQAQASGEITLGKTLDSSTLNIKVKFSLSENVLKSFVILDAILSSGKQPDGSYLFTLKGPLLSPVPTAGE